MRQGSTYFCAIAETRQGFGRQSSKYSIRDNNLSDERGAVCLPEIDFAVTFWGVRGSRPVPGSEVLQHGGNTACVEVLIGSTRIILDSGTGICNLGKQLTGSGQNAYILISHTHWDHIQGFPFFAPVFVHGNRFTLYGEGKMGLSFSRQMHDLMSDPHFPIQLDKVAAELNFREVTDGSLWYLPQGITIHAARNQHPNGALSFRVEQGGRALCYMTDTEHRPQVDEHLLQLAKGADLLIYDAQYTDEEYAAGKQGWGHSTWQEGVKLAMAAGVSRLLLFHHEPERGDRELAELEQRAEQSFAGCQVAREGMTIVLSSPKCDVEGDSRSSGTGCLR